MKFNCEWLVSTPNLMKAPISVVVACDGRYLRFAQALLQSMDHFSPGFDFILCVVNAQEDEIRLLRDLPSMVGKTSVSIALHTKPELHQWSDDACKTYYASVRFFFCQDLLRRAQGPLLCMDADSLVVNPLTRHISATPDPDVSLWRRDLEQEGLAQNLKVAAGVVAFFPNAAAQKFLDLLVENLEKRFADGTAAWFADQLALNDVIEEAATTVNITNLRPHYRDFDRFKGNSVVWSAKGDLKEFGEPFLSLSKIMGMSNFERLEAKHTIDRAAANNPDGKVNLFYKKHPELRARLPASGTIYLPRVDLPWKPYKSEQPPPIADDTVELRLNWKRFATYLAHHFELQRIQMNIVEIPAWEITAERVNVGSGDFAIIPHRCKFQLPELSIPARFYMQEYMPWLFTLDRLGWGAGASAYPVDRSKLDTRPGGYFEMYGERLRRGRLATKFQQKPQASLTQAGSGEYDIFFPLQIPHDQVIQFFSDVGEEELLTALGTFVRQTNLKMVLKPHPANMKLTSQFQSLVDGKNVFWSEDNFHDVIARSRSVFTINSSVGFEAMLHEKPIVSFGRSLYDGVTIQGHLANLGAAWQQCEAWDKEAGVGFYRGFYAWYCKQYAVDMDRAHRRDRGLQRIVSAFVEELYGRRQ